MNETISNIHLIIASGGVIITVAAIVIRAWINARIKIAQLEVKLQSLENEQQRYDTSKEQVWDRLNEMTTQLNDIKVLLQNKEDRK